MKIEIFEDAQLAALRAADIVEAQIKTRPDSILGLPTGSTPVAMYDELKRRCAEGKLSFRQVRTFNLDEYYPVSPDNECSYRYFMNKHLFEGVDIDMANTHVPAGNVPDPEAEGKRYDSMIEQAGGIDLQILGVGRNGHIGFNEPDGQLVGGTHVTGLTQDTIDANSRFFDSPDQVPKQAITMGLGNIMKAKSILLLVTGREKYHALQALLSGGISTRWPVTMLNMHPDVTVLCDRAACERLYLGIDVGGSFIKYGVTDGKNIIHSQKTPTCTDSAEALLQQIEDICRTVSSSYPVCAVGVGMPGKIAADGTVTKSINLPLSGVNVKSWLTQALDMPVTVENDANCAAWGEYCAIGEKGDMVMLTLGTGVGSGIIIDGEIYRGSRGYAGELGSIIIHPEDTESGSGRKGYFERYASAAALLREAEKTAAQHPDSILARLIGDKADGKSFFEAVSRECPVALQVLEGYIAQLTTGIDTICSIIDPRYVVIGGGISRQTENFFMRLRKSCLKTELRQAVLGNDAGFIGAAELAREMVCNG